MTPAWPSPWARCWAAVGLPVPPRPAVAPREREPETDLETGWTEPAETAETAAPGTGPGEE